MLRATTTKRAIALLATAALAIAACGGDDSGDDGATAETTAGTEATTPGSTTSESTAPDGTDSGPASTVDQGVVGTEAEEMEPVQGGVINFAVYAETSGLDPTVSSGSGVAGGIELAAIYDTLMRYDAETNTFVPQLAESLTADGESKVWTLKLRPGVMFSDGTPVDAEAVQFSLQRHIDRKSRFAGMVANIATFESPDPETLVMTLSTPWTGFPFVLAFMPGMVVSPTAVAAVGDEEFNRSPVGAGAFTVERYAPGEELVLVANPNYWNGAPYLDGLRFSALSGAQAVLDGLNAGDLQAGFIREALVAKKAQEEGYPAFLSLQNAGGVVIINHGRNDQTRPGSDVRIRQAIAHAIDPAILDQRADDGAGYPTSDVFGSTSIWHGTESTLTYDPDEAKRLVEEVKAETGWDGSISFKCTNAPTRINLSVALGAMLDAVGFKTTVDTSYTVADLIREVQVDADFDIACYGFNVGDDAPYVGLSQHLASTSVQNASGFKNAEFDALLQELRVAPDAAAAKDVTDRIQALWDQEVPAVVFTTTPELVVWNADVHGVVPTVKSMVLFDKAFLAEG